jgi:hypothetical protein
MRVDHESSDTLILIERALVLRAVGAGVAIIGAIVGASAVRGDGISIEPVVVSAIMITLGGLFLLLPATHIFAFSRLEKKLVVTRRWPFRMKREEIPLRDVANAFVQSSRSSKGSQTWRVVVQLQDERIIPVTSYYSSGYTSKREAADRMRAFLERAGQDLPDEASQMDVPFVRYSKGMTPQRSKAMAVLVLGFIGLVFGGIGGTMVYQEQQRLSTWIPAQATVLSKRVDSHRDDDGTTHTPVIVYRYYVEDRPFTSEQVLPLSESRSGGWAFRIVDQYEVGEDYTAYYDPTDPAQAFLRRSRSLVAPIFAGVGAIVLVVAIVVARAGRRRAA